MDEVPVPPAPVTPIAQPDPAPQTPAAAPVVAPVVAPAVVQPPVVAPVAAPFIALCPQCHFPVKPEYYYCPNCGKSLRIAPLSTSLMTQLWIYAFSIILPIICFVAVSYWPGITYLRSEDDNAKQIGVIACVLMAISTIVTFWLAIVWIQQAVNSAENSVGNLGGF